MDDIKIFAKDVSVWHISQYAMGTSQTKCLLIAAQNNITRTNYVKAKIDNTLENRMCWLCSDWNETVNYVNYMSECRKLAQKEYKIVLCFMAYQSL